MSQIKLGKGYANVEELFESEFGPDTPEEKRAFERERMLHSISETLFAMRNARNVTREAMAGKMGISIEDIVRIESFGEGVTFIDVLKYAAALGFKTHFNFSATANPAFEKSPDRQDFEFSVPAY